MFKKTMKIHRKKRLWKTVAAHCPGIDEIWTARVGGSYAKALFSYQCNKKKKKNNERKKSVFFFYATTSEATVAAGHGPVATGRWQVGTGGRPSTSEPPVLRRASESCVVSPPPGNRAVLIAAAGAPGIRIPRFGAERRMRLRRPPAEEISQPTDRPRRWRVAKHYGSSPTGFRQWGWLCRGRWVRSRPGVGS